MSSSYRWHFWQLEALAYWLEVPKPDRGEWPGFTGLVGATFCWQIPLALWLTGALRPL